MFLILKTISIRVSPIAGQFNNMAVELHPGSTWKHYSSLFGRWETHPWDAWKNSHWNFPVFSNTLPETNSLPLKIDLWKRRFLLETTIFRGYVSFRGCISQVTYLWRWWKKQPRLRNVQFEKPQQPSPLILDQSVKGFLRIFWKLFYMGVEPKIGVATPQNGWWKFHGKPYEHMDDFGG